MAEISLSSILVSVVKVFALGFQRAHLPRSPTEVGGIFIVVSSPGSCSIIASGSCSVSRCMQFLHWNKKQDQEN